VSENKLLRTVFGPKRVEMAGGWRLRWTEGKSLRIFDLLSAARNSNQGLPE
jgi:hypothetical protein